MYAGLYVKVVVVEVVMAELGQNHLVTIKLRKAKRTAQNLKKEPWLQPPRLRPPVCMWLFGFYVFIVLLLNCLCCCCVYAFTVYCYVCCIFASTACLWYRKAVLRPRLRSESVSPLARCVALVAGSL